MKKQFLLLAGSALILASCGSNNTQNNQQAQIDSIAKVNAAMQDAINKQKNDSTINAMAKAKADSIDMAKEMARGKGMKHEPAHKAGHKSEPTTAATPTPPPPPATVGQGKPSMKDQSNTGEKKDGTVGQGKPKMK